MTYMTPSFRQESESGGNRSPDISNMCHSKTRDCWESKKMHKCDRPPPPRATPQVFEFDQIPLCVGKLLGQTHCRSDRLRVVSNFCDGDCGAGEIHTRAYEISRRRSPRVASPRNLARVRVYFARPTIAIAEIRDYTGPGSWKAD